MSASTHQCAGIVRNTGLRCVSRAKYQHFGCEDDWYCVVHYRSTLEKERPKKDPPAFAPAVVEPAPDVKDTGKFFNSYTGSYMKCEVQKLSGLQTLIAHREKMLQEKK